MSLRFAGKHAAVVGATGVIGSRIAQAFARHGASVSLLGRSALAQRARLEAQLASSSPTDSSSSSHVQQHQFIKLDVSDARSIKDVFGGRGAEEGQQAVGPVDVLVNCAGISQTTFLKRTPDEELARIVDTNLLATMLVCKHARMQPHGAYKSSFSGASLQQRAPWPPSNFQSNKEAFFVQVALLMCRASWQRTAALAPRRTLLPKLVL